MSDKPTKQAIYAAMRDVNGLLTWAREHVKNNALDRALGQIEAAEISLALAKARVKARIEAEA